MSDLTEKEPATCVAETLARMEEAQKLHGALIGLMCAKLGIGLPHDLFEKLGVKVSGIVPPSILGPGS